MKYDVQFTNQFNQSPASLLSPPVQPLALIFAGHFQSQ